LGIDRMKKITGIKAISFDGDGTLWDFEKVMRYSLNYVLEELACLDPDAATRLDIEAMISIRNRVAEELKGKVTNLEAIRLEAFRQSLKDVGRPDDALAARLNQVYLKHRFGDIELFTDVLPTFKALQSSYTIGLLSNGNQHPERCGLEGVFRFVIFSQDYGVEKPSPEIFRIAVEKAGCSRTQLLHVGDSLTDDIMGAMNAGIQCVWLNRDQTKTHLSVDIDYEIHRLSDLLSIL